MRKRPSDTYHDLTSRDARSPTRHWSTGQTRIFPSIQQFSLAQPFWLSPNNTCTIFTQIRWNSASWWPNCALAALAAEMLLLLQKTNFLNGIILKLNARYLVLSIGISKSCIIIVIVLLVRLSLQIKRGYNNNNYNNDWVHLGCNRDPTSSTAHLGDHPEVQFNLVP